MEGAALHYVCLQMNRPFLQIRAISNYVTPRNRAAWKIGEAVMALNAQLIDWLRQPA
jgi:futalosine hydrolase